VLQFSIALMKNNASLIYSFCLVIGDFLALIAAFVGAYILRVTVNSAPIAHPVHALTYFFVFLGLAPFWILIFGLLGLYNRYIYEKRFPEIGRLLIGSFIGMLFVIFWDFVSTTPILPAKLVPIYGFILGFIFLVLFRNIARFVRTELFIFNIGINNTLIVGTTATTNELLSLISDSRQSGYRVVGIVGDAQHIITEATNIPVYSSFNVALANIMQPIHTIIQTKMFASDSSNREVLDYAQASHVSYRFVPGNNELFVGNLQVELFQGSVPIVAVNQTALIGWGRIVKRLFDTAFAAVLLIIASPFMLLIALGIKLTGGGTIFFRQTRLTRYNREFGVFKFHSQYAKYDGTTPEEAFAMMGKPELAKEYRNNGDAIANDPRITPFGRFLRKTSLDELPQLFNVIKGDISLVGPRALIPEELSVYEKRHTILSVKTGITGLAQVSGRRDISFEERRKLDIYYVQNWSFWLDLTILLKTFRVILGGS
jgi:exopolysaccharide biosynthesis polyprenyl glycosylphosphotransferase